MARCWIFFSSLQHTLLLLVRLLDFLNFLMSLWESWLRLHVPTCVVPQTLSSYGDRTFAAAGPCMWNFLPVQLRNPVNPTDCSDDSWRDTFFLGSMHIMALCDFLIRGTLEEPLLTYLHARTTVYLKPLFNRCIVLLPLFSTGWSFSISAFLRCYVLKKNHLVFALLFLHLLLLANCTA